MFSTSLLKVSNPATVKRKAKQLFGSNVKIVQSKAKNKKYTLIKVAGPPPKTTAHSLPVQL
jgi:hypothetical protein